MSRLDRRRFLTTSAALSHAWIVKGVLGSSSTEGSPRRLVCIGLDLSLRPENFFPTGTGPDFEVTPLLTPVGKWRSQMTVFSQLDHPGVNGGHNAVQAYLSGVRQEQAAGFPNGIMSLDQVAALTIGRETRFPSLCLGVGGGDSISWTRAGIAVPKIAKPRDAFNLIFRPEPAAEVNRKRRLMATDQITAQLVRQDARRMRPSLDQWDQAKLDEFETALGEFETGLKRSEAWIDRPIPTTTVKPPELTGDGCLDDVRAMYDVTNLALQCDATRVVSFNIGYGLPVANKIPGVNQSYHDLSHSGQEPEKLKQLHAIEERLMGEFDRFLGKLASTRDAAGRTLLENTVVLFGSGMGNSSSHSNRNLPIIVVGGELRHGKHLFFAKQGRNQTPLCNLYVTLLQHLGVEIDRFGSSDGNLNELLA